MNPAKVCDQDYIDFLIATPKVCSGTEKAYDIGYQPFINLNYHLTDDLSLGVVYRAGMDVEPTGDVKVKNIARPIGSDKVEIDWKNLQWLEACLKYRYTDRDTLYFNVGWQDWSVFSDNQLALSGGLLDPVTELDRNWKDTWHAGVAYSYQTNQDDTYSVGFLYDSSPVDDADRTFDLPVDEVLKISGSYLWRGKNNLDLTLRGALYLIGDAAIDETSQAVCVKG